MERQSNERFIEEGEGREWTDIPACLFYMSKTVDTVSEPMSA